MKQNGAKQLKKLNELTAAIYKRVTQLLLFKNIFFNYLYS